MSLDLDRITHPLRLASGSHQPGSGKGCAMNVISYINGDTKITDFPDCSARPLARIVQSLNDRLAGRDGFLSPEDSVVVLDIGWRTVGTAGAPREVIWNWLADLLTHSEMGVAKFLRRADVKSALARVAELCMRESRGDRPSLDEWRSARSAAYEARKDAYAYTAADSAAAAAAYTAADAAAAAAAYTAADAAADADAYAAAAAYTAADAAAAADGKRARIDFTRWAVERWRELAGLDEPADIEPAAVDSALARIHA